MEGGPRRGFNQKALDLEFDQGIKVGKVTTVASYPTEVLLMVDHREDLLGEDLLASLKKVQEEIIPGNSARYLPRISLARDTRELEIPNLELIGRVRAQEAADNICREMNLKPSARPAKWLTKLHNR